MAKNEDILILPVDKGKATVIMDKCDYAAKLDTMVSDTKVYELLKADPTPKFKKKLIAMLTNLKQVEQITQDQYWQWYPISDMIPRLYGSTKISKEGNPSD